MQTAAEREAERAAAAETAKNTEQNTQLSTDPAEILVQLPDGRVVDWESRRGFGATSQKLAYPERAGFHRHWFNDEPGRVDEARAAGYTPVLDRDGKQVSRVVDKTTGMLAYLHEVPQVWYEEDLKVAQRAADEKDAAILSGAAPDPEGRTAQIEKRYGTVKMSRQRNG